MGKRKLLAKNAPFHARLPSKGEQMGSVSKLPPGADQEILGSLVKGHILGNEVVEAAIRLIC